MSQHHLSVTSRNGATVKLVAGFDPRLQTFFLSLRDVRVSAPDEEPDEQQGEENPDFTLLNYDSLSESQPMRHISHVEGLLEEYEIPFGTDEDNPEALNPQLLPLLVVLLNEQQSGGAEVGRTLRNWDVETAAEAKAKAEAESEEEAEAERGFIRAEQYAEWAEEAKANREAEEAKEAEEEEAPKEEARRGWAVLKGRLTNWWAARH